MSVPKIKSHIRVQKENNLIERTKILKEINKITGNQLNSHKTAPFHNISFRKKVPRCKHEEEQQCYIKPCNAFKSQSCQTDWVASNEYEGVVRYPSSRKIEIKPMKEVGLQVQQSDQEKMSETITNNSHAAVKHVNIIQIPVMKPKSATKNKLDPCRAPPTYLKGEIPKYLQKLKLDKEIKLACSKKPISCSSTPINSKLAEREEKLETLVNWHDSYKQMVSELNLLSAN